MKHSIAGSLQQSMLDLSDSLLPRWSFRLKSSWYRHKQARTVRLLRTTQWYPFQTYLKIEYKFIVNLKVSFRQFRHQLYRAERSFLVSLEVVFNGNSSKKTRVGRPLTRTQRLHQKYVITRMLLSYDGETTASVNNARSTILKVSSRLVASQSSRIACGPS